MKKIIVIDDDPEILDSFNIILSEEGYKVYVKNDGEGLLSEIKNINPDLILLDFRLPGKNGDEITKEIRQQNGLSDIPIIIVSANYKAEDKSLKAGANDFIAKPFDIDFLLEKIKEHL
jgi:DNA-binding response OmpR family regulator